MLLTFSITQKSFKAVKTINIGDSFKDEIKETTNEITNFVEDLKKLNKVNDKYGVKCRRMRMAKTSLTDIKITIKENDEICNTLSLSYKGIGKVFQELTKSNLNKWLYAQLDFVNRNANVIQ